MKLAEQVLKLLGESTDDKANEILKVFLSKYSVEDAVKEHEEGEFGSAASDSINDIEFIFGNRELSATAQDGLLYHWFIDNMGTRRGDRFVLNSVTDEDGNEIE